jgi:signal transduction histidine kinase
LSQTLENKPSDSEAPVPTQWADARLIAGMRVILVTSALMIFAIDSSNPISATLPIYLILILYTFYSLVIYSLSVSRNPIVTRQVLPWLDLVWYASLIAFSSGTRSIFYYFFFFSIIVASFRFGKTAGLHLTLASAGIFTVVGMLTIPRGTSVEVNRLLLAPIGLLIFGYIISRWGGHYTKLTSRLQLLKNVTVFSNPRFGIDRTIKEILESVREFYDADACLLVISGMPTQDESYHIHRVGRGSGFSKTSLSEVGRDAASLFFSPKEPHVILYNRERNPPALVFDSELYQLADRNSPGFDKLAGVLDATRYLSVPIHYRNQLMGRLCVVNSPKRLDTSELEFALQLSDHVTPVIENMRLIDNLASDAAEQERQRIAHDIHDSVIQPYLGLQFGLSAISQNLEAGKSNVSEDLHELLDLTNQELVELRRYVSELRSGEERGAVLIPAIQRYAERFSSVTGIQVDVAAEGKINLNDKLAGELFQIVTEGLSNIRRHAFCQVARIELACKDDSLVLQIKNSRPRGNVSTDQTMSDTVVAFTPRSIAERAALLGGITEVFVDDNDYTIVKVGIPL